jgi:CheY-like chemotaxis protein
MHAPKTTPPSREEAEKWLRDALNHLYDLGYLENHPLGELLVQPEQATGRRGADLRKVLITAIQARKPARGTPLQSPDWRGYQILEHHILAGLSAAEVAQKLNISRSLFFLEKARILKVLFDDVWANSTPTFSAASAGIPAEAYPPVPSEAAQILEHAFFEPVEIRLLLDSLRPLVEPLAQAQDIRLEIHSSGAGIIPHGDRVLLRQVLLSLVSELLHLIPGGKIDISAFDQATAFGIRIEAHKPPQERLNLHLEERRGLQPETAQAVVNAMDGRLTVGAGGDRSYHAALVWLQPQRPQLLLLVDDHPDVSDLVKRHLFGTGWDMVWASSAADARSILAGLRPAVIILDVILPLEDGWEFLITLKADPLTRDIPVLVCSAINEPDLVRSLGAQGYLPKPFSAAQIVQALAPWSAALPRLPST